MTSNTQQNWHSKSDDCCSDICSLNLHKYLEGKSSSPNQHKYLEGKSSIPNQHKNSEGKLCSPFALTKSQGKLCNTLIICTSKGENRGVEVLVFCDLTFLFTFFCRQWTYKLRVVIVLWYSIRCHNIYVLYTNCQ